MVDGGDYLPDAVPFHGRVHVLGGYFSDPPSAGVRCRSSAGRLDRHCHDPGGRRNRSFHRALGVSMVGISASGAIIPPIAQSLVEAGGWRWAYEVFGWTSLCLIPLVFFTVVGRPEDRSEYAGTSALNDSGTVTPQQAPMTTREAFRERNLWVIAIACGLAFMVMSAALLHIPAHATDIGFTGA
ncbi:MAG: MFS transporter [Halioglobus sp.]